MSNPFVQIINSCLPEPHASLLNGILFGLRANFPKDFYAALITTGTIHIIALSGQNISILIRVISEMTITFGRRISIIVTILMIVGFVLFVGTQPTIVRAALMGFFSLLAVFFGRKDWALLSLVLAAGIMLLIFPAWAFEISFQLSFFATLGIILFAGRTTLKQTNWKREIKQDFLLQLRTTLAAQLFTVPIILIYFQQVSLISPVTNVLIGWTITPIMILGFITALSGWLFLPLGQFVGLLVWVPLEYLVMVVNLTAEFPFAAIKF